MEIGGAALFTKSPEFLPTSEVIINEVIVHQCRSYQFTVGFYFQEADRVAIFKWVFFENYAFFAGGGIYSIDVEFFHNSATALYSNIVLPSVTGKGSLHFQTNRVWRKEALLTGGGAIWFQSCLMGDRLNLEKAELNFTERCCFMNNIAFTSFFGSKRFQYVKPNTKQH